MKLIFKGLFSLLIICSFYTTSFAVDKISEKLNTLNGTFSGKITDAKTGAPIEAASIYISDIKSGTASDASGRFIIKNIPVGKHLVEISHIGYTSVIESIDMNADINKDFALIESIIENNAVVVTGTVSFAFNQSGF